MAQKFVIVNAIPPGSCYRIICLSRDKQVTFSASSTSTNILRLLQESEYPENGLPKNAYFEVKIKCEDAYKYNHATTGSYTRFLVSDTSISLALRTSVSSTSTLLS